MSIVSTVSPPPISDQTLRELARDGAISYRLIHTSGCLCIPSPDLPGLPLRPAFYAPQGLSEGEYFVEYSDKDGRLIPDPPGQPVVVSFYRYARPAAPPAVPAAPPAEKPGAPLRSEAVERDLEEFRKDPDGYERKSVIRQSGSIREEVMHSFELSHRLVDQSRTQFKEQAAVAHQSQLKSLEHGYALLEHQKQVAQLLADEQAKLNAKYEELRSLSKGTADAESEAKSKVNTTELLVAVVAAVQTLGVALISRSKSDDTRAETRPANDGRSDTERVTLVPIDRAEQTIEELLKHASPLELQRLLSDPSAAKGFAERMVALSGRDSAKELVKKSGGAK